MKRCEVDRKRLSPMMVQYMKIKDEYETELLFFRLGDFYELFFEDAECVSRELELTLTGKSCGLDERVPMCGVPYHAVKGYLEKLVNKGYRVAICEQLEDPKDTKGTVKRGVVDVISKGTITDYDLLDDKNNSYIASLLEYSDVSIITLCDISTGELRSISVLNNINSIVNEIINNGVKELILLNNENTFLIDLLKNNYGIDISFSDMYIDKYEEVYNNLTDPRSKQGVRHLFYYLVKKYLKDLSHVSKCVEVKKIDYLEMDIHTIRNLELVETLRLKERTYSLLWLLDKCRTSMGSRKLKNWLLNPVKNIEVLDNRYDKIDILNNNFILKSELKDLLYKIYDLERLCGKITCGNANGRDLLQLEASLGILPRIKEIINELGFTYNIDTHQDIYMLLLSSINPDAPTTIKEGYLIKEGYNKELDELKSIRSGGKDFVASFESKIKEETGIKNLKVGFNKVYGYYIEVSKGQVKDIKPEFGFERRQTLTNYERYISPELKEKEAIILNSEEKINELEYNLFIEIKNIIKKSVLKIKKTSDIISEIDCLLSLSIASEEYNLIRPKLNNDRLLEIKDGFHPVIEQVSNNLYVKNDCYMDKDKSTILITGPNMSGKSTYMRQIAITTIMAQMGSFVPAMSANLPIVDKIFTRIGASDDLVSGESTFMVEMMEARNALVNASKNSLIIFDELGRGTSTYDGMSLAEAILEYISKNIKCLTLFSTHYHELTSMSKTFKNIKNVHVSAVEENGEITFLHKVVDGATDKSYGIHVAKLAKMPDEVITRASEILNLYEKNKTNKKDNTIQLELDLFKEEDKEDKIKEKLNNIDILNITPMDAINILYDLKEDIS